MSPSYQQAALRAAPRPDPLHDPSLLPPAIFLTSSYSFLGLSLPFLASFVPLPPVALMIPIFYDRLIDNLSTNYAPPAKKGTT
jgi:hypothetical protein